MIKKKLRHNLTGGQAVVKVLEKEKVNYVFGLIGSATMEIFDSLYKNAKIKFIVALGLAPYCISCDRSSRPCLAGLRVAKTKLRT